MAQRIEVPGMGVIEFPDGMNDDDIAAVIQRSLPSQQYSAAPDSTAGKIMGTLDKVEATPYVGPFVKGARDVTKGGAQLLAHGINAVAPSILPDAELQNIDNDVRISEDKYQAARQAREPQSVSSLVTGEVKKPGVDWGRMAGGVAVTWPAVPLRGTTLRAKVGKSALASGGIGAFHPITSGGDYWKEKAKEVVTSAGIGAFLPIIGAGLSRVISPNTAPEVKALVDQGIAPTWGQILGGGIGRFEEKLTSLPILGDAIRSGQRRAIDQFNVAAYNRALDPIGQKAGSEVGREGVKNVKVALGSAYDDLLPKLQFKADQQFASEINNLTGMVQNGNVPPEIARQFTSILKNEVLSRMTKQGSMDGQSFKQLESKLGQEIKRFKGSQNPNDRAIGDALSEVLSSARSVLSRSNPQHAEKLANINTGYANYARIRDAASRTGAQEGVFTPAQLQAAVRAGDKSAGKGSFATGDALMQDLSESGKKVLGSKYPDSGTAGRLMAGPGVGMAVGAFNPYLAMGLGAGLLPYTAVGQKGMTKLLTQRPKGAASIANGINEISPLLGTGLATGLLSY